MKHAEPIWNNYASRPTHGTLFNNIRTDVCIVGLGGSGLSAALHACELGYNVVGIDAKFVAAEAAGRNGGFLLNGFAKFYHETRQQLGIEENKRIYQSTMTEIQWIKDRIPGCAKQTGVLRIAESEEEIKDCEDHLFALREDGFDAEYYDGEQGSGILIPPDGVFNPLQRAVSLMEQCKKYGAKFYYDTSAIYFGDNFVKTQFATIEAHLIIVAVDGYLHKIFPQLSGKIKPVRLQMASTKSSTTKIKLPVYSNFGYDYWQQLPDGRVAIGGGRNISEDTEYTDVCLPTDKIQNHLKYKLESINVYEPIENSWAGIVGYTVDGMPVVHEVYKDVWAVGGYNGTGNLIGPVMTKNIVNQKFNI